MKNRRVKGSLTLEAALVFPIILLIVFSIIYLGFYMHDKVKLEGVIDNGLMLGRNLVKYEIDMVTNKQNITKYLMNNRVINENDNLYKEGIINEYLQKELEKGFFLADTTKVDTKISGNEITVMVNGYMNIPFIEFRRYFEESSLTFRVEHKVQVHQTMNDIRKLDIGIDLITKYGKETD